MINTVDRIGIPWPRISEEEQSGRRDERMEWKETTDAETGACESVSRFATSGLRPGYKKTLLRGRRRGASAIQRSAHPATLAAGWTLTRSDQYRMESTRRESTRFDFTRLDSTRFQPLFTLVQPTNDSFKLRERFSYGTEARSWRENRSRDDSKRLINLVENPCTFIYICIHFRFVSLVARSKADDRRNEKGARGGGGGEQKRAKLSGAGPGKKKERARQRRTRRTLFPLASLRIDESAEWPVLSNLFHAPVFHAPF